MRHRWVLDRLYEQHVHLTEKLRAERDGTRGIGIHYDDVGKETLFALTFSESKGRLATRSEDKRLWAVFSERLEWGRRWHVIRETFGMVGIFGLTPKAYVPNEWIEKRLSQKAVKWFAEMVLETNRDAQFMAQQLEPLFVACMESKPVPPRFAFLAAEVYELPGKPAEVFWYVCPPDGRSACRADVVQGEITLTAHVMGALVVMEAPRFYRGDKLWGGRG